MERILKTKDVVKLVLDKVPITRDDDDYLYVIACSEIYKNKHSEILGDMPISKFALIRKEEGLPTYETVTRCRRKLQAAHEELRGKKYEKRNAKQKVYKDFALRIEED